MLPAVIATLLYLTAVALLMGDIRAERTGSRRWLPLAVAALAAHAWLHITGWRSSGPDMHFFAALSLTGLCMAMLTVGYGALERMRALGVVVYPLSAATAIGYAAAGHSVAESLDWRLQLHAWCALLAYAVLSVAALLAIFLWLQERALRRREFHAWLRALPPLTELETLLFRTIGAGFVLLTATLLSGVLFVDDLLAQHLVHKTVLSALSWLAFGMLLLGRWRLGWRGPTAVRWTLIAMALLVLAFFGSKYVLELVLQKVA